MRRNDEVVTLLRDLCFGTSEPTRPLLETGEFPLGWRERYLELVALAESEYRHADELPHALAAALYVTSVYGTKRYADWKALTGGSNPQTERSLRDLRWAADRLLLARYTVESHPGWRER